MWECICHRKILIHEDSSASPEINVSPFWEWCRCNRQWAGRSVPLQWSVQSSSSLGTPQSPTHTHTPYTCISSWIVRKVTTAECAVQAKDLLRGLEHWLTSKSCNIQRIGLNQQQSWGRRFTGHWRFLSAEHCKGYFHMYCLNKGLSKIKTSLHSRT